MILGQSSWYATDEEAGIDALSENDIKEVADVLDPVKVINTVKKGARKAIASIAPGDSGYAADTDASSGSVWPWILGLVVVGGGGYWLWRRKKKRSA